MKKLISILSMLALFVVFAGGAGAQDKAPEKAAAEAKAEPAKAEEKKEEAPKPKVDKGDTTWMLTATVLVSSCCGVCTSTFSSTTGSVMVARTVPTGSGSAMSNG